MSPEISSAKSALRAQIRAARAGRRTDDPGFTHQLRDLISSADVIAGYIGYSDEPVITAALIEALALGKEVLLPLLRPDRDLEWGRWQGEELEQRGNLLEPLIGNLQEISRAELLLIPALAVDRRGFRLGQGGGSYDRVLARTMAPTFAVVYDDEVVEQLPVEDFDRRVTGAVTPTQTVRF